ncbi:MAG TPA: hypothetical protein ENH55_13105 [Aurantimonas coralicida]|nr:hypothetical protein [Aurantimonas coralicida]
MAWQSSPSAACPSILAQDEPNDRISRNPSVVGHVVRAMEVFVAFMETAPRRSRTPEPSGKVAESMATEKQGFSG